MNPSEVSLFIGYPVDDRLCNLLERANPHACTLFINNESDYLHEIIHSGVRYLGKKTEQPTTVDTFELLAANASSLLSKLVPDYTVPKSPQIIPLVHPE